MDVTSCFLLPDGRLRAGWRLLLFAAFFFAAWILFGWTASAFFRQHPLLSHLELLALNTGAGLAAACLATWLMLSLLEHQSFWSVGLIFSGQSPREAALGLASGAGLVGTVAFIEWAAGGIHFRPVEAGATASPALLVGSTGLLVLAAANEELLFRGYPFQRLVEGTNDYVAVVLSSAIFGLGHWANPHSTPLSVANTMLAGALLSLGYLTTRALWLPIGFHLSWNWTLTLLGLPVSGVELINMPWQAVPSPNRIWLHGAAYGPEGGVVATIVLIAATAGMVRRKEKVGEKTISGSAPPPPCDDVPPLS